VETGTPLRGIAQRLAVSAFAQLFEQTLRRATFPSGSPGFSDAEVDFRINIKRLCVIEMLVRKIQYFSDKLDFVRKIRHSSDKWSLRCVDQLSA
jgi:hypothetical protein